jgi:hypothetical protein
MGTDCRLLAKLKDGTYRHRSLDRLYVFSMPFGEHGGIYDGGGLTKHEDSAWGTNYRFTLDYLVEWCATRKRLLFEATPVQLEEHDIDVGYHGNFINKALEFAAILQTSSLTPIPVEWVGLYDDMHDLYFDLENEGANIIDI